MRSIYYISVSEVPSKRANFLQSINKCNVLGNNFQTYYIYPKRKNSVVEKNQKLIFKEFNIKRNFQFIQSYCLDMTILKNIFQKLWFRVLSFTFYINLIFKFFSKKNSIIYTREQMSLPFLYFIKIFNSDIKLVYEAHKINHKYNFFLKKFDHCFFINSTFLNYFKYLDISSSLNTHKVKNFFSNKKNKINKKKLEILYFGSFAKDKGINWLLQNFYLLQNKYNLTCIGALDFNNFDKKKYDRYRNVKIYKNTDQENLKNLILNSDILIAPYLKNNNSHSPLKLYEYLSCNKIILTSDTSSSNFLKDKKNCIKFNINNKYDLIKKIELTRLYCMNKISNNIRQINYSFFKSAQKNHEKRLIENLKEL